ncbi:hypothetical protein GCG21_15940 [Pseudactinotalea sp. HY160]|uniref:hypothetical protein n=1 Tax=Pseudactinotalea sp. HY160 TaxID=2654490 RepID=UPI00128DBFA3|nr:hypothetical protein [Pseudactinotalea sp. HY160]MPV51471.1 hypothetical protein [Pseudactinotalea sp. HY160]
MTSAMTRRPAAAVLAAAMLGLTGCGAALTADESTGQKAHGDEQVGQPEPATEPASAPATPSPEPTPEPEPEGSRANPFAIGTSVGNETWDLVLDTPREAWTEIKAENRFNDPPAEGMEFWIVPLEATYLGAETGTAWLDIDVKFVGSDNRTYDGYCGVIPSDLDEVGDLYEGGVAEGNVCLEVPAGADGLWTVATDYGEPAFFAAE